MGDPAETRGNVANPDRRHQLDHLARIDGAQQALGSRQRHIAVFKRDDLLERGERVAQAPFRPTGDQLERLSFEPNALGRAHRTQPRHDGFGCDATKIETLAARMDGFGNLLRIGGAQDEHDVRRRLFKRLQQRVERRGRKHVDLVHDVDLVPATRRGELNAADDLLANVLDAGAACGVQFVHVRMSAFGDQLAFGTGSVGIGRRARLAQQRLGNQSRRGGLARAARAGEQVGMTYFPLLDSIFDGSLDMLLAHDVGKDLRAVLSVQRLSHCSLLFLAR